MNTFRKTVSRLFPIFPFKHHFTALSAFLFLALGIFITPESFAFEIPLPLRITLMISAVVAARKSTIPFILLGILLAGSERGKFNTSVTFFQETGESAYTISFCKPPQYRSKELFSQVVRINKGKHTGRVEGEFLRPIVPGEEIRATGVFSPYPESNLPWDRSHDQQSLHKNVHGTFAITSQLPPSSKSGRAKLYAKITQYFHRFSPQTASLLHALFLADRSHLSRGMKELFHTGGVSHLLALSGLHIATILLLINLILNRFPLRKGVRLTLLITLPWSITLFTGFTPSVVRALTMSSFLLGSFHFKRPANSLNSLGAAGTLLLFHSPFQLFTPGFLLSFAAVFGILLGIRRVSALDLSYKLKKIFIFLIVPISAALATTPITLLFFQEICPRGIISNLTVTPLFSLYFTTVSLFLIAGTVFSPFIPATEFLTDLFLKLLQKEIVIFNVTTTCKAVEPTIVALAVLTVTTVLFIHKQHRPKVLVYSILISLSITLLAQQPSFTCSSDTITLSENRDIIQINVSTGNPPRRAIEWLCNHSANKELIISIPDFPNPDFLRTLYMNSQFKQIYLRCNTPYQSLKSENDLISFVGREDTLYLQNQIVIP